MRFPIKKYYFSKNQRKGLFILLSLLIAVQIILFILMPQNKKTAYNPASAEIEKIQNQIDSIQQAQNKFKYEMKPFNPNFISDYKGYLLGMSPKEIDLLHQYRNSGKYVNSAQEFQAITGVSDELLKKISPYFKFPNFVSKTPHTEYKEHNLEKKNVLKKDLNKASKEDLIAVRGIGNTLADRILTERTKLSGFVDINQVKFVYGISEEVANNIKNHFFVSNNNIEKININRCNMDDLKKIPYITHQIARNIVIYRSNLNRPLSEEDLKNIEKLPLDKIHIIKKYFSY